MSLSHSLEIFGLHSMVKYFQGGCFCVDSVARGRRRIDADTADDVPIMKMAIPRLMPYGRKPGELWKVQPQHFDNPNSRIWPSSSSIRGLSFKNNIILSVA